MDVWEHAYLVDFIPVEREKYTGGRAKLSEE